MESSISPREFGEILRKDDSNEILEIIKANPAIAHAYIETCTMEADLAMHKIKMVSLHMAKLLS